MFAETLYSLGAIMAMTQGTIKPNKVRIVEKHNNETNFDFISKIAGTHDGMKVSADLPEGTYLTVRATSEYVDTGGINLRFGREKRCIVADCVISWPTGINTYEIIYLYGITNELVGPAHFYSYFKEN